MRSGKGARRAWAGLAIGVSLAAGASISRAQRVGEGRALTVIVGASPGETTMERLDVRRTNTSATPLPSTALRILWTRHVRATIHPPVVREDGVVVTVTDQGEALFWNPDGTEHGRVPIGSGPFSAPAVLSDGTIFVVSAGGDAVGVRGGSVGFRTHVFDGAGAGVDGDAVQGMIGRAPQYVMGRSRVHVRRSFRQNERDASVRTWVLPLEDGGAVAAVDRELVCLDSEGVVRSRAVVPAAIAAPLVASARAVVVVTDGGEAYTWDFRTATDAVRARGSFGGSLDGAVVALDDRHLLAEVDGSRLVALDLVTGEATTRTHAARGALTGAFAVLPDSGTALLEETTFAGTRVRAVDRDGHDSFFAAPLTTQGAALLQDAGGPVALAPTHTVLFADRTGAVAYGTIDGHVGVATPTGKVELGTLPCGAPPPPPGDPSYTRRSAGFLALVPAGPGAFVIACDAGTVALVRGQPAD